jgi:Na+-driven multidrug efflux pump
MKERALGGFLLAIGLVLGYLCVYSPLASAAQQEASVSVSLKGAILCPLAVVLGLVYLALGPSVAKILGTREKPTAAAYVLAVALLAVGVLLYFGIRSKLEDAGYKFGARPSLQQAQR